MTTESADFTRFMSNARMRLPGALDGAIQQEMFDVMKEFFDGTNIWREDVSFSTVVDQTEYEVDQTEASSINRLMWLLDTNDLIVNATMNEPGIIVLGTEPSIVETLTVTYALTVDDPVDSNSYPQFPAWVLKKYSIGLLDGVLGKMMTQPAKPYSNERLAIYHLKRFRDAVARARTESDRGQLNAAQRWRFPAWA